MSGALSLRGEFEAAVAGELRRFDTRLGTVAAIEERCGDRAIVELIERAVFGRKAKDRLALLEAALAAAGHEGVRAADATVAEVESFILGLMGALGFSVAPRTGATPPTDGGEPGPLARPDAGGNGGASRSVP